MACTISRVYRSHKKRHWAQPTTHARKDTSATGIESIHEHTKKRNEKQHQHETPSHEMKATPRDDTISTLSRFESIQSSSFLTAATHSTPLHFIFAFPLLDLFTLLHYTFAPHANLRFCLSLSLIFCFGFCCFCSCDCVCLGRFTLRYSL